MRRYDLYVKKPDGKVTVKKNRPLPPRPTEGMIRAVCSNPNDVLVAVSGRVWKEAKLLGDE